MAQGPWTTGQYINELPKDAQDPTVDRAERGLVCFYFKKFEKTLF